MKIVGIFSTLTERPTGGLDSQADRHIKSLALRGIQWFIVVFSENSGIRERNISPSVTVIPSSNRWSLLALRISRDVVLWLVSGRYFYLLERIAECVAENSPDAVYLEGLPLAPLALVIRDKPVILSCIDAMSLRYFRLMKSATSASTVLYNASAAIVSIAFELLFMRRCSAVHVVSEIDAAYLRRVCPGANICTIPVRIVSENAASDLVGRQRDRRKFIIWGDVSVPHLRSGIIWFFSHVVPLIESELPLFIVLGRTPPDEELRRILDRYVERATYLEWVESIDSLIAQCGGVILPDKSGTGLKNRAIHAMAVGTAVIGTASSLEGIPIINRENAYVCRTARDFVDAIAEVGKNDSSVELVEANAAKFVIERYSDECVSRQWQSLLAASVQR